MKKKRLNILLVLFALLLCGTALVACRYATVEDGHPAVAHIYQNSGIIKTVHFSGQLPYPQEISDWIAQNNERVYHITPVSYVPEIRLTFPELNKHFVFLSGAVTDGSYVRGATEEDKQFMKWLQSQPGTEEAPFQSRLQSIPYNLQKD